MPGQHPQPLDEHCFWDTAETLKRVVCAQGVSGLEAKITKAKDRFKIAKVQRAAFKLDE